MDVNAIVYRVTNTVNNNRYIGFTSRTLAAREWEHKAYARKGGGYLLQRAMRKYGADKFVFEVLGDFDGDVELAQLYEREAIEKYRPVYNLMGGGDGNRHSEETREKIRAARVKQVTSPETIEKMRVTMTGRKHSEATKEKLRALWKGKKRDPAIVEKVRLAHLGRAHKPAGWKHTPETLVKMRGRPMSDETREKIRRANSRSTVKTPKEETTANIPILRAVQCVDTGEIFASASAADKAKGFVPNTVAKRIRKKQRAHGLTFCYLDEM